MKSSYDTLGNYIRIVDERNRDLSITRLLGVSIEKKFISSIANTVGTDFRGYKIVRTRQFAYGSVTSRNGEKISVALLNDDDCIISSSYTVFEVTDSEKLLPEYLMLWFMRPEFDHYARYKSHGSVREIFSWDEMCAVELPVPAIEKQREIVKAYRTITDRIALKQRINENLEQTAQAIFKAWFVDFLPFGGVMPADWQQTTLESKVSISTKSINPQKITNSKVWHYSIPSFDNEHLPCLDTAKNILSNKYLVSEDAILVSKLNPETKRIWRTMKCFTDAICSTEFIVFNSLNKKHRAFYYLLFNTKKFIDFLISNATGSTNSRMRVKPTSSLDFEFLLPPDDVLDKFCSVIDPFLAEIDNNLLEIRKLSFLIQIAVAKMMSSNQ